LPATMPVRLAAMPRYRFSMNCGDTPVSGVGDFGTKWCRRRHAKPVVAFPSLPVWVGVDASVKHDSTAIVAVTWDQDEQKVRLIAHRIFQPSPTEPLDFEAPIESTLTELAQRFTVRKASISMQASQASMSMKLDSLVTNVLAIIRKNCAGRRLLRICSSHDPVCHGAIGLVCHAISKAVASVKARRDFRLYHAALV
jgi:hypothetical protein